MRPRRRRRRRLNPRALSKDWIVQTLSREAWELAFISMTPSSQAKVSCCKGIRCEFQLPLGLWDGLIGVIFHVQSRPWRCMGRDINLGGSHDQHPRDLKS